jgi:broad specificity polyphosphatase/5'/3'-nucleotidase SurE
MKHRCNNPNNQAYKDYGGRGIKVCDEWNTSAESFYLWALANGYVSVVPVQVDLTAYNQIEQLKSIL